MELETAAVIDGAWLVVETVDRTRHDVTYPTCTAAVYWSLSDESLWLMTLHLFSGSEVPLRNCSLTHSLMLLWMLLKQAMSTFPATRELMLQPSRLYRCPSQAWNFLAVTSYLVSLASTALMNGKISGVIVQVTNCLRSINMLVLLVITRVLLVVKLQSSTDFELVIRISPTLTYYRVTINQLVALVDIRLQSIIYHWHKHVENSMFCSVLCSVHRAVNTYSQTRTAYKPGNNESSGARWNPCLWAANTAI